MLIEIIVFYQEHFKINDNSLLVIIAGNFGYANGASYVEIGTLETLKDH